MQVKRNPWTPAQLKALDERYPHERTADIVVACGHSISSIHKKAAQRDVHKTPAFKNSEACGHFLKGGEQGKNSRFTAGHATWNKGMKGLQIGGEETQFKKGNTPRNHKPVGTVVIRTDGYSQTKIAEPNVWELTHRLIWRLAGNEPPIYPVVLRFKDRNKLNCTIENLELSSKLELMTDNSVQALPTDLRRIIQLRGVLTRAINGK